MRRRLTQQVIPHLYLAPVFVLHTDVADLHLFRPVLVRLKAIILSPGHHNLSPGLISLKFSLAPISRLGPVIDPALIAKYFTRYSDTHDFL